MSTVPRRVRGFPGPHLAIGLILCLGFAVSATAAVEEVRRSFAIAAGFAEATLEAFSEQANVSVVFPLQEVRGVATRPVQGKFAPSEALERLIAGTGLDARRDESTGTFVVRRGRLAPASPDVTPPGPLNPSASAPSPTMKSSSAARVLGAWFAFLLGSHAPAADAPAGAVEGRIYNARSGEYIERARVSVDGTSLEAFTDSGGQYRLANVPAGTARIRAFFTGFEPVFATIGVTAGGTAQHDFTFGGEGREVVKLSEFVVGTSREMDGAAIAINEQRFAPNIKTVVATDELGFVPEGNVAEFIKFMPGIAVDNVGGFARSVSLNGVPSDYVPVTIDGFSVASANPGGGTSRSISLDMLSINNLARVEVTFSPTPESQGSALAGGVNMVPRSAFERAKPALDWNAYLLMRDNARDFRRTPGPQRAATRKVHPGFDFTYIKPVTRNFGFTISAGTSTNYLNQDLIQNTWRGTGAATNGTTFPHTTPDQPYLSSTAVRDNTKDSTRNSFSTTMDARLGPADRVTFSFQFSSTAFKNMSRTLTFNVGAVDAGGFTPFSTRGRAGAGTLLLANTGQTRDNRTVMPTLVWRHRGPIWQAEAGAGYSRASHTLRNMDRGLFNSTSAQRTNVTVSFADIFYLRPRVITVSDGATGAPVDPYAIANYALLSAGGSEQHNSDTQRTVYSSLRRSFDGTVPVTVKAGIDVRRSERDLNGFSQALTYVGADGRASTTLAGGDDAALPFLDPGASQRIAPYGFPRIQWVSNEGVLDFYRANPKQFVGNPNADYRSAISASKNAAEMVSAAYLRGDVDLLQRRLQLIGGLRVEQTNVTADGPLTDPTRNFQRTANGALILGPNGRPLPITSDALQTSQLTFLRRGAHVEKEYLRLFPSLNASHRIRENLVARAAVYQSVGRPNLNQYAGGVTLPDTESAPSTTNRIVVNNAGIKSWTARTANVRLEYYFEGVGQISFGAFRRNYQDFSEARVIRATPEFFDLYGIDPAIYGGFDVATQENIPGTVKTSGVDASYKQSLTFLPRWARGVQVFANGSAQRATGAAAQNFSGYVPRTLNWGASLTRAKYNLRANWNYRGRSRQGLVSQGASIDPATYSWTPSKLSLDLQAEYQLRRGFSLFANLRNVTDATEDAEISGPVTPEHAQFRSREDFGSLWTFGLKGTF